ncbi:Putative transcriptional regulators (Ypuh-like) [Ancylobacter rudongensis]|uniref:Putative transcriptional regulators (Ypuh-like) n=1 Tax=Ancylobacter rudongensis TaxID=177413 RepID=A0A1G4SZ42_9HYPH|nr:Putative transcriptional regulators (Ypuh-like) [Ancylobacter rudongensis]
MTGTIAKSEVLPGPQRRHRCAPADKLAIVGETRAAPARLVGLDRNLDLIIDDIRAELRGPPYELVAVAGGWQHRTRTSFTDAIQLATGLGTAQARPLSQSEALVLLCIGYFQPISRDVIGHLRSLGFITVGPSA